MAQEKQDFVPEWAKKAIWYQIFPDRFNNGDKSNDPDVSTLKGSYPQDYTSPWEIHPWTSDWYELQPYEKKNGKNIWYNIQRRRYGGDLQGIINKIPYLKELGINAIYLNPVFDAPSLHKYDAKTYHHVDPNFGPDPKGDRELVKSEIPDDPKTWVWTKADKLFLQLVKEAHAAGMHIIIDGVFNHLGIESWPFQDVVKNQEKSKYKDWFTIKSFEDKAKGTKLEYEGWFGVKELPELREDENGIVAGPKKYIFDITKRWMDPDNDGSLNDGIDGWRLDVAFCIKHPFWKDWRKHVKSINPQAYITAEIVDPPKDVIPYLSGDEFDAVMNYNYLYNVAEFFIDESTGIKPTKFLDNLEELRKAFPSGVAYVQQNLNNSHDTERLLTAIVNKDKYKIKNWGPTFDLRKGSNKNYDTRKPNEDEIKINKLIALFQFTYVGAPYIYYGEEAGMWGANDPDERKPMVWRDLEYDSEKYMPDQSLKPNVDEVSFNEDLYSHYNKLINIRKNYDALSIGSFRILYVDDKDEVLAYEREYNDSKIVVIINNSNKEQTVTLPSLKKEMLNLYSGETIKTKKMVIDPKAGLILH